MLSLQFKILFIYLCLAVLNLGCCVQTFSSCGKRGILSSCNAWASHCSVFSCCGAWALGHMGSLVAAHWL